VVSLSTVPSEMSTSDAPAVPHELPLAEGGATSAGQPTPSRRASIGLGAVVALLIVAVAWFVGGRQGFDQIGQGGINLSLLPKVGDPAPDVVVALTDGTPVRLSDLRGRPVWLNFWGSWCPPCRAEMPELQAAHEQLAPRGLVLLAISLNEPTEAAADYAALNHVTFLVASDPRRLATGNVYPILNFPTHILIDQDGIVRDIVLAEFTQEEIVAHAQTILPNEKEV
jgi:cytochrome c biogenesis protein CcmG, thiol:disulfide interchange protein DsbE